MTDKTIDGIERPGKPEKLSLKPPPYLQLPERPSFERAIEDIEKWANSSGLRKPE